MFIFLPHIWMDGCYYFLNLILLSCLSFMPLFKKKDWIFLQVRVLTFVFLRWLEYHGHRRCLKAQANIHFFSLVTFFFLPKGTFDCDWRHMLIHISCAWLLRQIDYLGFYLNLWFFSEFVLGYTLPGLVLVGWISMDLNTQNQVSFHSLSAT